MGKLLDRLNKQLTSKSEQEVKNAEDCIKIYNQIKETTGRVWQSDWTPLVTTTFTRFDRLYKPTAMGYVFLKGIECS